MTRLLRDAEAGDERAARDLLPLVYAELRDLARGRMAAERKDHTLSATALVHEAYLRLVGPAGAGADEPRWQGRGHFFAAAAEAMRRILVENARRKRTLKRGGAGAREAFDGDGIAAPPQSGRPHDDLLALDEALGRLTATDPDEAELVKLRYFAGLTAAEAAQALGISEATANRRWAYAKAWLHRELSRGGGTGSNGSADGRTSGG